jgi:hypothetical protein
VKLSNLKWNADMTDAEAFSEGVLAPRRITATATGHDPDYDLEVEIELERGRYVVRSLQCQARKGGAVTSEGVTHLPVKQILRIIVGRALGNPLVSGWSGWILSPSVADQGPTDEALKQVAAMYRVAHLMGLPPTGAVAQGLSLARSTAGRWVSMARQRGFLGKAEPRKAGERPRRKR